jgi:1-pyrroline-5-carboxylate dehydrogenase
MITEFRNEELTNFTDENNKQAFQTSLAKVKAELGKEYPLIIGGEKVFTDNKAKSVNPANKNEVVGIVSQTNQALAEKAMQAALERFKTWQYVDPAARADYLFRAAALLRRRKFDFAAWQVYEVGKNWAEADGDVAEAIDFMEYYAREMIRLGEGKPLTPYPGERNRIHYIPLGVGIIIPPWNFPLAIMAGMTTSAIVAGNTVLLKPASPAMTIAAKFVELMEEVGLPAGVLNYVPGPGSEIGDYLVSHPKTRFVSFTGSKEVGLHINELAAKTVPGQIWVKRVIAEMGGKDAIVVDASADLEEAASAIVASAFGFQGQKCSAGSRAIVHTEVYDQVLQKVIEKTKALNMGSPEENLAAGPVVDQGSYKKILEYIEIGKSEGRLVVGGGVGDESGFFIQPTVFADVKEDARIMKEEIFGPVLAFSKADSFEHAMEIFNNTEYGLTGSLYTGDRSHYEYAEMHMHCGNLYFNRKCTGAFVGVHPFGGFNMSGTDSKTGGPDYLLLFTQSKLVSEKY